MTVTEIDTPAGAPTLSELGTAFRTATAEFRDAVDEAARVDATVVYHGYNGEVREGCIKSTGLDEDGDLRVAPEGCAATYTTYVRFTAVLDIRPTA